MKKPPLSSDQPACYRLLLQGEISIDWSDWLMEANAVLEGSQTIITGRVRDQAALFGLLNFVRDLGMPLLLVEFIPEPETR